VVAVLRAAHLREHEHDRPAKAVVSALRATAPIFEK